METKEYIDYCIETCNTEKLRTILEQLSKEQIIDTIIDICTASNRLFTQIEPNTLTQTLISKYNINDIPDFSSIPKSPRECKHFRNVEQNDDTELLLEPQYKFYCQHGNQKRYLHNPPVQCYNCILNQHMIIHKQKGNSKHD